MPILARFKIQNYKEILLNQPAGLVSDGGLSTYTLDDPLVTPNGTGDFLGLIKTVVLLGEVYRETVDTGIFSFEQFRTMSQAQFDNFVRQGMIVLNHRQENNLPQRVGWVELGRSHASFYYQSCNGGKRPISEHYYDIGELKFSNAIVIGEGSEIEPTQALVTIGSFNNTDAQNNLGILRPGFEPLSLAQYIIASLRGTIINTYGESFDLPKINFTNQVVPSKVDLFYANRYDHFENNESKSGFIRRTINEAITPGKYTISQKTPTGQIVTSTGVGSNSYGINFAKMEGNCLPSSVSKPSAGGPIPPTPEFDDGMTWAGNYNRIKNNKNIRLGMEDYTPSLSELEIFKQHLIAKMKESGFVYDENIRTMGGEQTIAIIIPDYKKYPEMLQLMHGDRIRKDRLIRKSQVDLVMKQARQDYFDKLYGTQTNRPDIDVTTLNPGIEPP